MKNPPKLEKTGFPGRKTEKTQKRVQVSSKNVQSLKIKFVEIGEKPIETGEKNSGMETHEKST